MSNIIEELVRDTVANELAKLNGISPDLLKADTFTQGINGQQLFGYNLDGTVKFLYPYLKNVPLVAGTMSSDGGFKYAAIPRKNSPGGLAARWKTITAIDTGNMAGGVGRGQRGAEMKVDSSELSAPFFGLGVEVATDFETQYEAGDLINPTPLEISAQSGLRALIIQEEKLTIGGNNSVALGTAGTPTVVDGATSGGTVGAITVSVIIVALTNDGYLRSSVTGGVIGSVVRSNIDSSTLTFGGGSSAKSAAATLATTANHTQLVSWAPKSGAVAYAVYWGTAGNELLGAITTHTGYEILAAATGTQNASAITADNSKNAYVFDGLLTMMAGSSFGAASNSYIKALANGVGAGPAGGTVGTGSTFTGDGAGGIKEFDALLLDRWNNFRLGFTRILCNAQEAMNITPKILTSASGVTSLFRTAVAYQQQITVGQRVTSYHNKFTGEDLDIIIHPWVPPGTIIFHSDSVPYPLANVANILEFETRQGYYQIPWPLATRQWQSGVYVDECLKHFFLPAEAMITNIGNA